MNRGGNFGVSKDSLSRKQKKVVRRERRRGEGLLEQVCTPRDLATEMGGVGDAPREPTHEPDNLFSGKQEAAGKHLPRC